MRFATACILSVISLIGSTAAADDVTSTAAQFADPPDDCRPRTRWWWMGNAITKEEISLQLRKMHSQGIRGVEQITMPPVYEEGNTPYLSEGYFELLKHAVAEARGLGMSVSLNFGGPGWVWVGDWIPPEERNQTMLSSSFVVAGPGRVDRELSTEATINPRDVPRSCREITPGDRLIAVVAGRETEGVIDPDSLQPITDSVQGRRLVWQAPEGTWRVMAFWSTVIDNAVNHIDKQAMARYVEYLGGKYAARLGEDFGETIESFFGDSFEVPIHRNGFYWSNSLPEEFQARKGYDLVTHLPAVWWELGEISPKVRYDLNDVLHAMGMEAFFETFADWCHAHGVKARIQPYGFVTDNIQGAGASDIPEMEVTAGEKDAVPWFDPRIGPREYVASGAHIYGRNIVSVEAYTFIHWQPYRATLEELKIASDMFLKSGANLFYNHGFLASPEPDIAPSRGFYPQIHIAPDNVWWPFYHVLSDYVGRCCYMLRQGKPVADLAVYSPLANQWTEDALNARKWTRQFDWGELNTLLIGNGYSYDLVNDDALQRLCSFDGQTLKIGEMAYRALIVPNVHAMPVQSLRQIEAYARQGGVVVALERAPEAACGLRDWQAADEEVRATSAKLFNPPTGMNGDGRRSYGAGTTYRVNGVLDRRDPLDRRSSVFDPFLNAIRRHVPPDMAIDFVRQGWRENPGLCFAHRKQDARDIYFVTNVQDHAVDMAVGFRVTGAAPSQWDPYAGETRVLYEYEERNGAVWMPIRLAPYESAFYVFEKDETRPHAASTSLASIERIDDHSVIGWTSREGGQWVDMGQGETLRAQAQQVPAPLRIAPRWRLALRAQPDREFELDHLVSWTELPGAGNFSGAGVYTAQFDLPAQYAQEGVRLRLNLGDVGNIAEVALNGKPAGIIWMRGQTLDVAQFAVPGANNIEIRVTNTLINRVAGMSEFPPVPEPLQPRLGNGLPEGQSQELLGFSPLPRSGLLGPVEIHAYRRVEFSREVSAQQASLVKLHRTQWSIGGKPVMGTYGAEGVPYLQRVRDAGMNLVLAGEKELDTATPEGAFCLENGIRVMPHVTSAVYHGVKLGAPIAADQTDIPLYFAHGMPNQESNLILIDDELIRYDQMTQTGLLNCRRGCDGTQPAEHREGIILFWPEPFKAEIARIKNSPNLYGYYVLDDSPGDAVSALRGMYKAIREADPDPAHPVCAGFGDAGSVINLAPGVCDIMMIYWYPVGTKSYDRDRTAQEVQHMLATARRRVPGIPFMGIYHAFDGRPAQTGQGVPTPDQLREQLEDFVREGACGLVSYICHHDQIPGWADIEPLGTVVTQAMREINDAGGLQVRPETESMKLKRIQPQGYWKDPLPMHGYVPAWHVIAPFQADPVQMLDTPIPPEQRLDPDAVCPVNFGAAKWRIRQTTSGTLGINEIYTAVKNGIAYAFCDVAVAEDTPVQMRICTDDDAWVRLNGKEVYRFTGGRGLEYDKDIVPLTLPKGSSRIELKCLNRAGMWGVFMRFTDAAGEPVDGLKFSP